MISPRVIHDLSPGAELNGLLAYRADPSIRRGDPRPQRRGRIECRRVAEVVYAAVLEVIHDLSAVAELNDLLGADDGGHDGGVIHDLSAVAELNQTGQLPTTAICTGDP